MLIKNVPVIIKKISPALCLILIALSSCSLNYGSEQSVEETSPEIIFENALFNRYEDKRLRMNLSAEKIEQYKNSNSMFAKGVEFSTWNEKGVLQTTGQCGYIDINRREEIYHLFNDIIISSIEEKIDITAQNLKWNNKTEQLISGRNDKVTLSRNDLKISGTGFSASGVSKEFKFSSDVKGTIETDKKDD